MSILNRKNLRFRALVTYLISFLIVLIYVCLANLSQFNEGGYLRLTTQEIIVKLGLADAGNYLRIAQDMLDFEISPDNYWIVGLWPPGMALLNFILLIIPGPYFIALVVVSALITSIPISIVVNQASSRAERLIGLFFGAVYLIEPNRHWAMTNGLFNSDGVGSALLLTSALLLYFGIRSKYRSGGNETLTKYWEILAGVTIVASLSLRWAFLPLFIFALLGSFTIIIARLLRSKSLAPKRAYVPSSSLKFAAALMITALPWTSFVFFYLHPGNPSWSTGDYQWAQRWMSDDFLHKAQAGWLVEGGANWSCEIDLEKCKILGPLAESGSTDYQMFRDEAIESAATNPVGLLSYKTPIVLSSFVSVSGDSTDTRNNGVLGNVFLALMLSSIVLSVARSRARATLIFSSYIALVVSALYVAHIETRYLLPVWDLGLLGLVCQTAANLLKRKPTAASKGEMK